MIVARYLCGGAVFSAEGRRAPPVGHLRYSLTAVGTPPLPGGRRVAGQRVAVIYEGGEIHRSKAAWHRHETIPALLLLLLLNPADL